MKPDSTVYFGSIDDDPTSDSPLMDIDVTVGGLELDIAPSLKLRSHSPTGFAWGYGGSGPSQLALAICLDFLEGDADRATRIYQDFRFKVIAILNQHACWKLSGKQIRETIESIEREQEVQSAKT